MLGFFIMRDNIFAKFFNIEELSSDDNNKSKLQWLVKVRDYIIVAQYLCLIPGWALGFVNTNNIAYYLLVFTSLLLVNILSKRRIKKESALSSFELFLNLAFDISQLSILVSLTGGWSNPFSSMTLIYIILSAVMLPEKYKIMYVSLYISIVILINSFHFQPITNFYPWTQKWLDIAIEIFVGFATMVVVGYLKTSMFKSRMKLEAIRQESLRRDRLRAIGALSGGVCHRIASPLNNMKLRVDRLYTRLDEGSQKDLESIESSIERIEEALGVLTSVSNDAQPEHVKFSRVDISELLRETALAWKDSQSVGFELDLQLASSLEEVSIPETMFTQSLLDMLDNALEAGRGKLRLHLSNSSEYVTIAISDNGKGFDKEIIKRLGEPFNSTNISGRGLGLYQAKIMCQYLGGELEIESSSSGSTVFLNLSKEVVHGER